MAKGVMHIQWYATFGRSDMFLDGVIEMAAPAALRNGATHCSVQRSRDDHYKVLQQIWFDSKDDWYRYWEGPEMCEFRARYSGKYQAPIMYIWHDEFVAADAAPESDAGSEPGVAAPASSAV